MKKTILGAIAALTAMVASPVVATPVTSPSHVALAVVSLGELVGDIAPVRHNGKKYLVRLSGCNIRWNTGESFYAIGSNDGKIFITPKYLMDYAWSASGEDWDTTIRAIHETSSLCRAQPVG